MTSPTFFFVIDGEGKEARVFVHGKKARPGAYPKE